MKYLKYSSVVLYLALVVFVFYTAFPGIDMPRWWFFSRLQAFPKIWTITILEFFVLTQAAFILVTSTGTLIEPIGNKRLLVPALTGSAMITAAMTAIFATIEDLLGIQYSLSIFLDIILFNFAIWGVFFYVRYYKNNKFRILRNLSAWILIAAAAELIISSLAHLDIRSRAEWAAYHPGTSTSLSVLTGLFMLLWIIGPYLIVLFLNKNYEKDYRFWREKELIERGVAGAETK